MFPKKVVIIILLIILLSIFLCSLYIINLSKQKFNVEQFKLKGYTLEEIMLFNDIAFLGGKIRKWETDIRVEIKGNPGTSAGNIDSAINEIAPLIKPLSIKLVKENGNLIVKRGKYRFLDKFMKIAQGRTEENSNIICPAISKAWIIESYNAGNTTLLHELEHAIGISHPRKSYPFLMKIIGGDSPQHNYDSIKNHPDRKRYFHGQNLTDQEKKAIQMFYSSGIKSGLTRKTFMDKMGLHEDPKIWRPTIGTILIRITPYFLYIYALIGLYMLFVLIRKIINKKYDKK